MYTKDLEHKISLRLDDDLFQYVCKCADVLGLTPSKFIRMCLHSLKATNDVFSQTQGGVDSHVDEQTNINDKL